MSNPVIQTSFNAGEWAPALNARVDLQKYHQGAALLRNFFVDYRGGATTRPGTKYILQCYKPATQVRLIPFQASFAVNYILEFGDQYIRFFNNGSPVVEAAHTITGIALGGSDVIITVATAYNVGDWVYLFGIVGTTQLNTNYYIITAVTPTQITIRNLNGSSINQSLLSPYVSGGTTQRILTLTSPYLSTELSQIKFAQNVNTLILTHPNHAPYILTLISATNWTIAPIVFGTTLFPVVGATLLSISLPAGSVSYGYCITPVDINGQEGGNIFLSIGSYADMRGTPGSISIEWNAPPSGPRPISYNVYKAVPTYNIAIQPGVNYGFIGNVTGTIFTDNNITPDFSETIQIPQNPFSGASVASVNLTNGGFNWYAVPNVVIGAAPPGGAQATAICNCITNTLVVGAGGSGYVLGEVVNFTGGASIQVTSLSGTAIASFIIFQQAIVNGGILPAVLSQTSSSAHGTGAQLGTNWSIYTITLTQGGAGYIAPPPVTFINGGPGFATATTTLGASGAGNPTVAGYHDQRLILAGPVGSPAQFNMSQPGSYFNFNITDPVQADNAIQATLSSTKLNSIKSLVSVPTGLIMFTDQQAWLVNGGGPGTPVAATAIVANSQSHNGASDLPPITANYDILYVQSKGSIVRDLAYNFYTNIYTGADISLLSSHLFFGFTLTEWTWAEEPYRVVWAVRNDGQMLNLTFLKEQELIAWAHSDTQGLFKSVTSITESVIFGSVDAVYTAVQRTINGQITQYIERFTDLYYPQGYKSSWQVDAGIQYSGAPATFFSGATHLAGMSCVGVADGQVINVTISVDGTFTLPQAASLVTVGLSFLPQLQTLRIDLGEPTAQGKRKKISAVTVRCANALGLFIGNTFSTLTAMKDLILGNVGTMSNTVVTDLVSEDARTIMDPNWTVQGQVCLQQNSPYPASILGVIPEIEVGDTQK